ncbi:Oidioi.mRNA.OKI2018_I69.PAR.g10975.t1.cds [Oikopleura dioica]|uniref:Oidioi.mRNA.OKI2018_I69.PAR.g10975.t1.cds n=1 Tax=Oikopleura dioica TaxID=34765 RepID=A0ABN7RTQ2_OIKDI|nr:Oidioi.mRNA.OKI2018_I69.PAR.g10975.t1.cds [Oikopleura dioica]
MTSSRQRRVDMSAQRSSSSMDEFFIGSDRRLLIAEKSKTEEILPTTDSKESRIQTKTEVKTMDARKQYLGKIPRFLNSFEVSNDGSGTMANLTFMMSRVVQSQLPEFAPKQMYRALEDILERTEATMTVESFFVFHFQGGPVINCSFECATMSEFGVSMMPVEPPPDDLCALGPAPSVMNIDSIDAVSNYDFDPNEAPVNLLQVPSVLDLERLDNLNEPLGTAPSILNIDTISVYSHDEVQANNSELTDLTEKESKAKTTGLRQALARSRLREIAASVEITDQRSADSLRELSFLSMTDKLATKIINDVTKIISSKKKSKLGDILSKLKSSPAFTAKEAEKLFAKFLVKELNTKRVRIPLEHIEDHVSNHKDDFGSGLVQAVREEPVRVQKSSEEPYLLENQEAPHSSKNLPTVLTKNVEASEQMLFMPQEVGILSKSTIEHLDADVRLEKISRASREEEGSVEQNQEQELNIQPRSILKKNKTTNSEEDDSDPDWIDENPAERLELEKENLIGALEEIASTSSVPSILEALSTLKTTEEIKSEMQNLSEQNQNTLIKMQLLPSEIMKNMLDKSTWKNENVILKAHFFSPDKVHLKDNYARQLIVSIIQSVEKQILTANDSYAEPRSLPKRKKDRQTIFFDCSKLSLMPSRKKRNFHRRMPGFSD